MDADTPAARGPIPLTMQAYELGGTPSVVLIDRQGRIRLNQLGRVDDMALGALIGELMADGGRPDALRATAAGPGSAGDCDDDACAA